MTESPARVGLIGIGRLSRALARLLHAKRGRLEALLGRETRVTGLASALSGWIVSWDGLDLTSLVAGGPDGSVGTVVAPPGSQGIDTWLAAARPDVVEATPSL